MDDIEVAEKTLAALTDKRDRALARTEAMEDERQAIGFAVHADGDRKARTRLDQLNIDAATITESWRASTPRSWRRNLVSIPPKMPRRPRRIASGAPNSGRPTTPSLN